ncbi:hypothetical protein J504_2073 [Acinetobacter baumannii 348935]|nr:hypothetical protein J504_2073 [Acinetobacter baumannii 348935]BCT90396.1 hypothetical protein RYU24_28010 [Acinetobacter variabilis]
MSMPSGVLGKCKPSPPAERAQKELRWPIWPPLFTNAAIFSGIKTLNNIFLMKNIGKRLFIMFIFNLYEFYIMQTKIEPIIVTQKG